MVRDVMTQPVVTVLESASYKDVVDTLAAHAISAVPVVDDDGRVVGVVSEADLLYKMEFAGEPEQRHLLERKKRRTGRTKAAAGTAASLMSSPPIVVNPVLPLSAAARVMDAEGVKRLPVVDGRGKLVGIVSRRDLLRVYLRDDDAIRDEILQRVLHDTLWIPPERVTVTVERGVATLAGTVDRKSTIPLAIGLVEAVAGVVDVVDHLSYHFADDREPTADIWARP